MKNKYINGALFAVALAAVSAGFTSCSDEPDKYEVQDGVPTIDYVRPVDAASKDSLLSAASLNNTICIVGRNLRSVTKINFNDQAAVLNTSYMTDNTIIVTVPKAIPNEVSDKIYQQERHHPLRLQGDRSCSNHQQHEQRVGGSWRRSNHQR